MANIEAVKAYLSNPSALARFVASQVHQLERLANTCQNVLKAVASGVGVDSKIPAWGIGSGCCNGPQLELK
jgi:hypothetical protein